jgi:hypothetical protein
MELKEVGVDELLGGIVQGTAEWTENGYCT